MDLRCTAKVLIFGMCWLPLARAETFFYLVRQWPFTFCGTPNSCFFNPTQERFTIHGLWKNFDTGKWPSHCTHETFDVAQLEALRPALDMLWPSYYNAPEGFWSHEWEKHGTCAESLFHREVDYFNATLRLHAETNLERAFLRAGIRADPLIKYTSHDIAVAVEEELGAQPLVHCASGKLSEVWMCFDDKLQLQNCNESCTGPDCHNENCAQPMLIPPHQPVTAQQ